MREVVHRIIQDWNDHHAPGTDKDILSERHFQLITTSGSKCLPLLTVELYVKWYSLYLVERVEFGVFQVTKISFDELEPYRSTGQSAYVDHVPNPRAVVRFAEANKYILDEVAHDLIAGRWYNEVLQKTAD